MTLHKEGTKIIIGSGLFILVSSLAALNFTPSEYKWIPSIFVLAAWILYGFILNFFRNPSIQINANDDFILSPCDGKVVVIEEVDEPVFFKKKVRQISVFMSPLNVHVNRNPIGGTVKVCKYIPGEFLVAFDPKSSERNERTFIVTENERVSVAYKQIAGYVARRICWYIKEGDKVGQGEEFGFIKFGSRIDILIPLDCEVNVKLDEVVKAGRSVLAKLPK